MILDIIVTKEADGYTAEIPSIKGCESWAEDEEEVLDKILELAKYYMKLQSNDKIHYDKARGTTYRKVYKLVVNKQEV